MNATTSRTQEKTLAPRDRHQLSLMHVFRAAHADRDAAKEEHSLIDGDRELTQRSKERRAGTDEETLRQHLSRDMASLMNTVNLDATVPLDDHPYLRKSVANFGFGDLSQLAGTVDGPAQIAALIRKTLLAFEPRLIADTLEVTASEDNDAAGARLTFDISAEMAASPVDIPLNFVAEVDNGAGKIQMTKLRVQT